MIRLRRGIWKTAELLARFVDKLGSSVGFPLRGLGADFTVPKRTGPRALGASSPSAAWMTSGHPGCDPATHEHPFPAGGNSAQHCPEYDGRPGCLRACFGSAAASSDRFKVLQDRCPRGSVGQTAGGGSIPRWSASKPQVVTRQKAKGAGQKKKLQGFAGQYRD